jgi:hypothetical protein
LSQKKDEQFSAEVEKRLQNLFNENVDEQIGESSKKFDDTPVSSKEDEVDEISESDLLDDFSEDDLIDEIVSDDLLDDELIENAYDDDLDENVLDDDLDESVLDDNLEESVLDDDFDVGNEITDDFDDDLLVTSDNKQVMDESVDSCDDDTCVKESGEFQFYPFRLLKSIILSIDWEITDDVMERFVAQVTGLMETYKDDRFVLIFLHLLWELGKYIKKYRGQSHPNSIKTLISVYNALEKIVSQKGLDDSSKKKILSAEMIKFKTLKDQIALLQGGAIEKEVVVQPKAGEKKDVTPVEQHFETSLSKTDEKVISDKTIDFIRTLIRSEIKAFVKDFLKEFDEWASRR